jgi:pimeloyl-ACP methyl ester carboxylesterase
MAHLDESQIRFDDAGTGPVVVLIHGFPLDRTVWREVALALRRSCRVINVDLPGFGESAGVDAFTMSDQADALARFIESRGFGPVVMAGLSMGGYVAQAFAASHEPMLRGLVLVGTKHVADDEAAKKKRDAMIELVRTAGAGAIAEQMMPSMFHRDTYTLKPALVQRLRAVMNACPAVTIAQALAAMRDRPDHSETLRALSVPLQVIVGEGDVISTPELMKSAAAMSKRSSVSVVEHAGHLVPLEEPDAVAHAIAGFMRGVS